MGKRSLPGTPAHTHPVQQGHHEQGYCSGQQMFEFVTPAKAGVQKANPGQHWIPAFAGMTVISDFIVPGQ